MATLYKYQEQAVEDLLGGKHIVVAGTGCGKGAMAVLWAQAMCKRTKKKKVLVITTASKSRTGDFEADADLWCGSSFRTSLSSFSVLSWHKLRAWVEAHLSELNQWVVIADEVAKASAGVSSGMGKAFLRITQVNKDWAGFTATPGDTWLKFYPYFQACGFIRNKTHFMRRYAQVQTFKGFPEIVGYHYEDELKGFWEKLSTAPDTKQMMAELPSETHKVVEFKKAGSYDKTLRTRISPEGDMLDTAGALCAELRRQCFTKDKQQWVKDFVENLGDGAVMFYNFTKTGDALEEIVSKALPKGARVWRIDGKHHEIPTAETIGKYDIVLCQWQSGSEALNLQFLHYWVSVELCYSYSTFLQALGRIKRIGQKNPMFYFLLLCNNSIELTILKCLRRKKDFAEDVWEKGGYDHND